MTDEADPDPKLDADPDPTGTMIKETFATLKSLRDDIEAILERAEKRFDELEEEYRRRFGF